MANGLGALGSGGALTFHCYFFNHRNEGNLTSGVRILNESGALIFFLVGHFVGMGRKDGVGRDGVLGWGGAQSQCPTPEAAPAIFLFIMTIRCKANCVLRCRVFLFCSFHVDSSQGQPIKE